MELRNDKARGILKACGGPQFDDFQQDSTCEGSGQVVAVADTGYDTGHIYKTHAAFRDRVIALHSMSKFPLTNDSTGHGTHVCGLVLGDGREQNNDRFRGTAPKAKLAVQCLGSSLDGIPVDLKRLFGHPYLANNVRVHTNSWGSEYTGEQLGYTSRAREIDQFVRLHEDMVIGFSAGNDGNGVELVGQGEIGAEAAAKNCITVGASENDRLEVTKTYGHILPDRFPNPPIRDFPIAGDPNRVAAFSSRPW